MSSMEVRREPWAGQSDGRVVEVADHLTTVQAERCQEIGASLGDVQPVVPSSRTVGKLQPDGGVSGRVCRPGKFTITT